MTLSNDRMINKGCDLPFIINQAHHKDHLIKECSCFSQNFKGFRYVCGIMYSYLISQPNGDMGGAANGEPQLSPNYLSHKWNDIKLCVI